MKENKARQVVVEKIITRLFSQILKNSIWSVFDCEGDDDRKISNKVLEILQNIIRKYWKLLLFIKRELTHDIQAHEQESTRMPFRISFSKLIEGLGKLEEVLLYLVNKKKFVNSKMIINEAKKFL